MSGLIEHLRAAGIQGKLDDIASDMSDVKVAVARLETKLEHLQPKNGLVRDGGITLSGGAVGAAIVAILQHFAAK